MEPSPALVIRFSESTSSSLRDQLVAALSDFQLVAIQEDDLHAPRFWTAHFATHHDRDAAQSVIKTDAEFADLDIQRIEVADEDWARRTQADLPAIRIGRVTIAPPWDLPKPALQVPDPNITILIEPSRGFGTGHHQSTRLCIVLLQSRSLAGLRVVDVGTGSGVLAITAAKLGADHVSAMDNDPDAVENARENIAANAVGNVVEAHVDDLTTTTVAPADLVTANLTGTLLSHLASDLARLVRRGGSLIVSGFNIDEKARVAEAMSADFELLEVAEEEDWFAFVLTRSGPA